MSLCRALACVIAASLVLTAGGRVYGQAGDVAIADLKIGFNGAYKLGHWTPVEVILKSTADKPTSGALTVRVADGDASPTAVRVADVTVPARGQNAVKSLVKIGRPKEPIEVAFDSPAVAAGRTFTAVEKPAAEGEVPAALLATQQLIVEVGRPIGLVRLQQQYPQTSLERPTAALVEDPRALPPDGLGYDGVDLVAVATSDEAALAAWDQPRLDALQRWIERGGKLVLCAGRNGKSLSERSPLAVFLPGQFAGIGRSGPAVWESFAGALTEPLQSADGGRPDPIPITELRNVRGRVELYEGTVPVVVRTPHGFGEVVFVAADLDRPPFDNWPARAKLLLRVLNRTAPGASDNQARETSVQSIRLGYTDLSGQLRAALGQYRRAAVTPFWLVFLMALAYAAALFPLEYAVARWLRPRFEMAWLLLPLVLAASAGGVWYTAWHWKGSQPLVNKVDVVDADLSSGQVRGRTWFSLYSPRIDTYDVALDASGAGLPLPEPQVSWLGLPGMGLGGMNSEVLVPAQFDRAYSYRKDGSLAEVPLAAWSSKTFEASWHATIASGATALAERSADRQPLGVLTNETQRPLRKCVLFYEGWSYMLGDLESGASVDVGKIQRLQTITSYLTGRRAFGDKEQATPYVPDNSDLGRIAQAILFHDAAGGPQYTSLSNRVYERLDMSDPLRQGRAVLMATGEPATRASVEGTHGDEPFIEQDVAFYRFVIPVNRTGRGEEKRPTVELRLD